jgi:hypothetical protein
LGPAVVDHGRLELVVAAPDLLRAVSALPKVMFLK